MKFMVQVIATKDEGHSVESDEVGQAILDEIDGMVMECGEDSTCYTLEATAVEEVV